MGKISILALILAGYGPLALAQDQDGTEPSVEALTSTLEHLKSRHASAEASRHVFDHALVQAALLVDPYAKREQRQAAAQWLASLPTLDVVQWLEAREVNAEAGADLDDLKALGALVHEKSFGFIASAARDPAPSLRETVITVAPTWGDPAVRILRDCARREVMHPKLQRLALDGLGRVGTAAAADALYDLASDQHLRNDAVEHARAILERDFADYLSSRGGLPQPTGDGIGQSAAVVASAAAGAVVLSSVGIWGQSDMGAGVGGLGGAAIGAGTGYLYTRQNPVSQGQGLRYASNVAWGLAGSQMVNEAVFGFQYHPNMEALVRTVGTGAGAWLGFRAMQNEPTASDVLETNAAGLLGASTATSIFRLATHRRDFDQYSDRSMQRLDEADQKERAIASLVGSAVGLGIGTAVMDEWEPDVPDLAFASMTAFVTSDAGGSLDELVGLDDDNELRTVGTNVGAVGGLLAAHAVNPDWNMVAMASSYSVIGKVAGIGVGELSGIENGFEWFSSPFSIAGTVGGALASNALELDPGHIGLPALGTAVLTSNTAAVTNKLRMNESISSRTHRGTIALVGAASAGTLLAVSSAVEPSNDRTIFAATGAGWGLYYGSLAQVVIPGELPLEDASLITTGVMDAGVLSAVYLSSDAVGINPQNTFIPQLVGLAGGTVGALGVMLANDNPEAIAAGALAGSTAGLVGGALFGPKRVRASSAKASGPRPKFAAKIPGSWSIIAVPSITPEGSLGGNVQVAAAGL